MTEREMFEQSFRRPSNFFELSAARQWEIDEALGILDWTGEGLSSEDKERFRSHYSKRKKATKVVSTVLLVLFFCSCQRMPENKPDLFPPGTRVFVQPDSTEGVVSESTCGCGDDKYVVRYKDLNGTFQTVTVRANELVRADADTDE